MAAGVADRLFDIFQHLLVGIQLRLLRQIAGRETVGELGFAVEFFVLPGHDPQQRALARAVAAQHADLGAGIERKPDILEHLALAELLDKVGDLIDVLWGPCDYSLPIRGDNLWLTQPDRRTARQFYPAEGQLV